jgi:hypothetical protein
MYAKTWTGSGSFFEALNTLLFEYAVEDNIGALQKRLNMVVDRKGSFEMTKAEWLDLKATTLEVVDEAEGEAAELEDEKAGGPANEEVMAGESIDEDEASESIGEDDVTGDSICDDSAAVEGLGGTRVVGGGWGDQSPARSQSADAFAPPEERQREREREVAQRADPFSFPEQPLVRRSQRARKPKIDRYPGESSSSFTSDAQKKPKRLLPP